MKNTREGNKKQKEIINHEKIVHCVIRNIEDLPIKKQLFTDKAISQKNKLKSQLSGKNKVKMFEKWET